MILNAERPTSGATSTTLDELFRRAGVRDPDAQALTDPPNREQFLDGPRRSLTYAETDRAISCLAKRLRDLGLPTDSVVAMQLPNTVESVVAFLAILRAGMIAAPLPMLWRREEMTAALAKVGAKAIITCARMGSAAHAEIAVEAAANLFTVRQVCGFGPKLPDGAIGLDDIFDDTVAGHFQASVRPGSAAAHLAAITFGVGGTEVIAFARSHSELVAGGLSVFLECEAPTRENFLSTIPISSFAGLSLTLMPWLLSGGSLHLHHGFNSSAFADQASAFQGGVVAVPSPAVPALLSAGFLGDATRTIAALWRRPERLGFARTWNEAGTLLDVAAFGEIGLISARRNEEGRPAPLPHGVVTAPRDAIGAMTLLETAREDTGTLAIRGPMVPVDPFPPGDAGSVEFCDAHGYHDTAYSCRLDRETQTLSITAPPPGMIAVGGYVFAQRTVEARVAAADPGAVIVALPDSNLGQRLAGTASDRDRLLAGLPPTAVNPLISGAFRSRTAP